MSYIFMDESGDLGLNLAKAKTSRNFIVTIVFFENIKRIKKIIKNTYKFKRKIGLKKANILHSFHESARVRKYVLERIANEEVKIMCISLNKSKVYTNLYDEKNFLYNYVVNILLDRIENRKLLSDLNTINLTAAKKDTNKFLNKNFKNYLETSLSCNKLNLKVNIKTPHEDTCLQAVDFISWSIFRKLEHKDSEYYNLIKPKIIEEGWLYK